MEWRGRGAHRRLLLRRRLDGRVRHEDEDSELRRRPQHGGRVHCGRGELRRRLSGGDDTDDWSEASASDDEFSVGDDSSSGGRRTRATPARRH